MEQGADICSGKLAGAAGSSQPHACRGKPSLSTPELLFLTSPFFLQIPPRSGREELGCCTKSKCAEQSQEEIRVSPEPGARRAPRWVQWGCVRRAWAHTHPRAVLERGPDPEQTEIKGKADLGLKEVPETALLSELFSECVQQISEWSP